MTNKQKIAQVKKLVKKYSEILNISHWKFNVVLKNNNHKHAAAEIHTNPVYMFANIDIYPCAFDDHNDIEHIIKHELCHCLTEPMYLAYMDLLNGKFVTHDELNRLRENLTERIALLI